MAQGAQCHDGEAPFMRLKADVRPVEMKSERGIKSQSEIPSYNQQQLIQRSNGRGKIRSVAEFPAAIDDPTDSFRTERPGEIGRRYHRSDPVNPRDADRPESPLGLLDLCGQGLGGLGGLLLDGLCCLRQGCLGTLLRLLDLVGQRLRGLGVCLLGRPCGGLDPLTNLKDERTMATNPTNLPKAPLNTPTTPPSGAPPMSTADVARAFDLFVHFVLMNMQGQGQMHPDDITELKAVATRIRASSNL